MSETTSPPAVYLDASFLVAASIGGLALHDECAASCANLVTEGATIYFSRIVLLEFSQVIFRLPLGAQLPTDLRREYDLDRWHDQAMARQRWMRFGARELERLVGRFAAVSEVDFDFPVWYTSIDVTPPPPAASAFRSSSPSMPISSGLPTLKYV